MQLQINCMGKKNTYIDWCEQLDKQRRDYVCVYRLKGGTL